MARPFGDKSMLENVAIFYHSERSIHKSPRIFSIQRFHASLGNSLSVRSAGFFTLAVFLLQFVAATAGAAYPSVPLIITNGTQVVLENFATLPLSGRGGDIDNFSPPPNMGDQLARANFLVSEPDGAPLSSNRFFVPDLNRNLYILDKTTKTFIPYINFQSVFPRFYNVGGFAAGLITIAFDPAYSSNGIFYTVHVETPGSGATPTNVNFPALNLAGYQITSSINAPSGGINFHNVLVEWRDTNINNATFEGTAREVLRTGQNNRIHPMGDLLFNPLAQSGDSDYRNLYIAVGDGGSGETTGGQRNTPQRLVALQGKILRITPDINLRPADELSSNGRYRIPTTGPDANPFVSVSLSNLKKEIYAYGLRNPHRIYWDAVSNLLFAFDIGLHSYEEVNIIRKGLNYGYSQREGTEQLFIGGTNSGFTGDWVSIPFTNSDALTVTGLVSLVTPIYPVATYSHVDGDAVSSGNIYRGTLMPHLRGKCIFGDITTGRIFYCDLEDLLAADDGVRTTVAAIHEIQVMFNSPYDNPDAGITNRRLFDIVSEEYDQRGGTSGQALPGDADVTNGNDPYGQPYGSGRADMRIVLGGDGELYVISKSDGVIRRMTAPQIPNAPPVLDSIPPQEIPEGSELRVTNSVMDDGQLTFSLGTNAPAGATINPTNGIFSWTPTEDQGPATNSISIIVTDDGTPSLSATQAFSVVVMETNSAPVLNPIDDLIVHEGETVIFHVSATDTDLPTNNLAFEIDAEAPVSASINTNSGLFIWSPGPESIGTINPITVRATDDGSPQLFDTEYFEIMVVARPNETINVMESSVVVQWDAISNRSYRVQFRSSLEEGDWTNLDGDVTASDITASKTNLFTGEKGFYRVIVLP
jgi:hypothetical protein